MESPERKTGLQTELCFIHTNRSAAARCPSCSKSYCRECVVEHHGMMLCQSCIASSVETSDTTSNGVGKKLGSFASITLSTTLLLGIFYLAGYILSSIPSNFHRNPSEYYLNKIVESE